MLHQGVGAFEEDQRPVRRRATERRVSYTDQQDELDAEIAEIEANEQERKKQQNIPSAFLGPGDQVQNVVERVIMHRCALAMGADRYSSFGMIRASDSGGIGILAAETCCHEVLSWLEIPLDTCRFGTFATGFAANQYGEFSLGHRRDADRCAWGCLVLASFSGVQHQAGRRLVWCLH